MGIGSLHVVFWGTFDTGKPRNRILIRAIEEAGLRLTLIHGPVWEGVEDKSQVASWQGRLRLLLKWIGAYPSLVYRYLRVPTHDVVIVGYLGQLDVLIIRPLARLRRVPVVWDMFVPLFTTLVEDRRMLSSGIRARLLWGWERLACAAADVVVMDTEAHRRLIQRTYRLAAGRTAALPVGAELDLFPRAGPGASDDRSGTENVVVLFYGQFIPLHGIHTIVEAAQLSRNRPWRWKLIGTGQEEERIRRLIAAESGLGIEWDRWVPYDELHERIAEADVCLGIFGSSEKAASVVPNKAYQILAVGRPLITRDSPAIRELIDIDEPGVVLVPPEDPEALVRAVEDLEAAGFPRPSESMRDRISPAGIAPALVALLEGVAARKPQGALEEVGG